MTKKCLRPKKGAEFIYLQYLVIFKTHNEMIFGLYNVMCFLLCLCWMLNLASQFDIFCNLPEIKGCQILHPFLAIDIFELWQNLDFSPFVSYEGRKSRPNCWPYPEIKEGDQVVKIAYFEKKIYCPTWGFDPPKIRISEEFSTSRGRCTKCKRLATLIMRECNI